MKLNEYPDPENLYICAKNTDALIKAEALSKGVYEPPIMLYMNEIQTQIEDNCLKAVQSYGFNVDKDELKKALDYDRGQYDKGYADARKKYERPMGEWIYDSSIPNWVCSLCGAVPSDWGGKTNNKYTVTKVNRFCRLCGADMRKEAEHDSN